MHEIIYLQLGNLPNFIGTHFWNAQNAYAEEEVDNSVSWSTKEVRTGSKVGYRLYSHILSKPLSERSSFSPESIDIR
jgi:Misato Segment II tubulin-like domain